jgi:CubicO group peptidase (beta-lactamase class C family)
MPFANKFRAMMDFPFAGDTVGDLAVESVDVRDERGGPEGYAYAVRIVLRGPGGKQGVQRALAPLFSSHPTTFSGYGNPYQLWFGKPEIESLGDKRYAVSVKGAGVRVYIEPELARFLQYLDEQGHLLPQHDPATQETLVETYLEQYRAEIKHRVDRYRRRLQKTEKETR